MPVCASDVARRKDENSRLLREDLAAGRVAFRALPEVVTLNHTDLCNLRCVMCPRNLAQGTHRLSRRILGYLAEELFPTARKLVLTTSGGEPLAADFDFLLERALRHSVVMDVVTNGVLLTPQLYREARPALDHLNVSIDSHLPEVYERVRLGARFDAVMENLHAVRALRRAERDDVLYSASAVVMRSNLPHLGEFVRFAAELGFDGVVLQKLLHSVKPTPEEEPTVHCGKAAMRAAFDSAAQAARAGGINLYATEFGLPAVLARPVRAKRPDPLLHHRMCWFMAQNFGVMYTGEVYPCCIPTDHLLGNVLYEDPVEIWNGPRAQALRRAQAAGRGTLFCSGCLHAPHLKARRPAALVAGLRLARRAWRHGAGKVERALRERYGARVIDPPRPPTVEADGGFERVEGTLLATRIPALANDVAAVAPDGSLFLVRDGVLSRAAGPGSPPERVCVLRDPPAPRACALRLAAPGVVLVAFVGDGRLERIVLNGARPKVETALQLSDERAFVRQHALLCTGGGAVLAGEYGVHPGSRCGVVHRAPDPRAPFVAVQRFDWARHVHTLFERRDGSVLVTTGDLAGRRRLLRLARDGRRPRVLADAWAGYIAIAETATALHFGTELREENALLRRDPRCARPPELRRLPDALDLQVRTLVDCGGGRIVALLGMDADLVDRRAGRRAALLESRDDGRRWGIVHEFAADWSDAPEMLLPLPGPAARLLTLCSDVPTLFELR
jgi:MoaA/NifB/PqqE/SkfB family radical SAM enzyme